MSSEISIKVENLSKCYQIYNQPRDRLKQFLLPRLQRAIGQPPTQYFRDFWALKDVSFEVRRGETVGIIGRNGSGKSTLLQMICGTLSQTSGKIHTRGRVAALLELGSGFNPEFTGRENVYLNGSILGLSNDEIDSRYEQILAFADIGAFINQPIKTYSSGMVVRLAFAVQSQVDPDILIVDEALSVGDARFQAKCFERLRYLKENGTSILLVTHSSEQIVAHCSSAFLLNDGVQIESGEPRRVVNRYMDLLFGRGKNITETPSLKQNNDDEVAPQEISTQHLSFGEDLFSTRPGYNPHEYRWGDGAATILDFDLSTTGVSYPASLVSNDEVRLILIVRFNRDLIRPILGITLKTKEGISIYGTNSELLNAEDFHNLGEKDSAIQVEARFKCRLAPGDYFVSLGIATKQGEEIFPHDRRYDSIHLQIEPSNTFFGLANLDLSLNAKKVLA